MIPSNPTASQQPSTLSSDFGFFGKALDINSVSTIPDVLNAFFMMALSIGAILAVLRLVYAGYLYTTSDIWENKGKAKEVIREAVVGLIMLLSVWLVLNTINPDLLNLNILRSVKPSITPQASYPPGGV
jgi:hypothetical protein